MHKSSVVFSLDVSAEGTLQTCEASRQRTDGTGYCEIWTVYGLGYADYSYNYADVVTTFTLTTKDMPAAYDEENKKLVEARRIDDSRCALKAYLGNITSVNDNWYKMMQRSGRSSVSYYQ